jgi:hypothetical protein
LVIGTSEDARTPGLEMVDRCAERGVPTVGVVDSPIAASHRFRGKSSEPLTHAPDWLLVPDAWTVSQYVALGYPRGRVVACGHPHWDFVRAFGEEMRGAQRDLRTMLYPEAPETRPILLFAAELSTGLDPREWRRSAEYTLTGRGHSAGRTEIVMEEFLDAVGRLPERPFCVLRLHPKNELQQFKAYLTEFDQVSQAEYPLEVLLGADAVVGMTTILLLEAVLLGRPTLSVVPRECEREWLVVTRSGLIPCATIRTRVERHIARLLAERPVPSPAVTSKLLPYGSLDRATRAIVAALAEPPTVRASDEPS